MKTKKRLLNAFPKVLRQDVKVVIDQMDIKWFQNELSNMSFSALLENGEVLTIPERIYFNEVSEEIYRQLAPLQQSILCCIYSRHHDGFVREKYVTKLDNLLQVEDWMIPYLIKFLGEGVIELLYSVNQVLEKIDKSKLNAFKSQNEAFIQKVESQLISYWNEYYREEFPSLWGDEYIGFRIFKMYL